MYISELELHGFKSFAHKTHVKFDSGITAIVGPNGCGKSNIVDALRWVLGEQRPSLLRSSSMSNVIFNGTAKKKALGLADVSLTFVNNKGILPSEYSELTITRRLYRSGDSEYLINNTPCRLKDIMELFMDTGMSSDAYSVIELKMVEEILNDRNNDRRRLFEEAAGVTRYKDQRKRTLRKLDQTLKDLQRLEDILVEVRKKARSLEIQAEKAAKAKKYQKELVQLDKGYNRHQFLAVQEELKPLKERIENAEKEKREISEKLNRLEESEEKAGNRLIDKERAQAEAQRRVSQLQNSIKEMETNLRIVREKIKNEQGVISGHENDIKQTKTDLDELIDLKQNNEKQLNNFADTQEQSERSLKESKEKFNELQQQYTQIRHELYELEIAVGNTNKKLRDLQSDRIKLESKLENSEDDRIRINRDIEDLEDEIDNAKGELNISTNKLEKVNLSLSEKEEYLQQVTKKREQLEIKRENLREAIRSEKSKMESVKSEISLMESLSESSEGLPGSVAFLIENHSDQFNTLQTIGNLLQTDEDKAAALEAALGDAIHFIVVDSMQDAVRASGILKENKKGRATFIPLAELAASYETAPESIFHHIHTENKFTTVAQLLTGSVMLTDSIEEAIPLPDQISSAVTPEGDLINSNRFYKSGSRNKQAGIRLGIKDKLDKLYTLLDEHTKTYEDTELQLQKNQQQLEQLKPENIRQLLKVAQKEVRKLEQEISRYQSGIQVYQKNINDLINRKENISENEDRAAEQLDSLQPEQKELQEKIIELTDRQKEKKELMQSLEEERAIAQNRYNDAQLKHQDVKNRAQNLEKEIERAERGIESMKSRLESRKEMMTESAEKIEKYKDSIEQTELQLERSQQEKLVADEKLSEAEKAAAKQRGEIKEINDSLKELRRKKEVNTELVHHLTMAKEKFEMQAQSLSDHVWETYGVLMDQLTEELPGDMSADEAKNEISRLKQRLNRIGEVNHLAIDEYEEEKERLDFYEEQIDDLQNAEKEMRETIDEINQTATERFNKTFEQIRVNFQSVFHTLFEEDDNCDLLIEKDVEDPLEAKIEIIANPRGKRPSSINQLSGGEKTLTAIALLFAIYLVKPSPFCVLDEVDAPLDDANIERFASMIRSFSKETQFIIITHNKKTMSKAEMMYGVTMPETGVSRLVGVRLDEVAQA
ncbi:chromosome segregation protein SMC [Rhodohalobacter sp. SW132]|uniref:chromosome segregation protein SMC n=1 Tax=Rhodohalobacter sp. SW132 TaxID=2293433 RepID=UPI000E26C4BB|nr:chromosome segregation protein SMC [Rhodohalobacter sp. SW132]REL25030.1 chromosome segregation protein SMC [Rhodohalobacter sp. SW132]